MLEQEAATLTVNKSESDGELDARRLSPEFFPLTTTIAMATLPEPMDQDAPIIVPHTQSAQQASTGGQVFSTRAVSVAPLQNPGPPQTNTQPTIVQPQAGTQPAMVQPTINSPPVMVKPTGNTQPRMVQQHTITRPIVPQASKVIPSPSTMTTSKPMYFATSSSPSKLIAIPSGNISRFIQGIGNMPRIQIVPTQPRMTPQNTLRPIAPRLATSVQTAVRPQVAQIQMKPAAPRAAGKVLPSTSQQTPGATVVQPRVLLQARPGSTQLRAIAPNLGNLPPGATIQFPAGTIIKDGVVYVPQQVQQSATTTGVQPPPAVQITPAVSSAVPPVNGLERAPDPPSPSRQRKPCNCTKSQCLKLYCDCFANGEFCSNCNCNNCYNNIEHEGERSKAIKACLERNPHAFHPKIGKGKGESDRRHNKGCHCKRSGCLKNYCECYEAKILCTNICKCTGCKNFEESPDRKTLMHLADAAAVRVQQQNAAKTKLESQMEDLPSRAPILAHAGEKLPFSFVTRDVVEATCQCLLVQASAAEKKNLSRTEIQKLVLEEFGNCLLKIIHTAKS